MTTPRHAEYVLTIVCPDRPGIVFTVASFLVHSSANILESQQFDDRLEDRFFMRVSTGCGRRSNRSRRPRR